MTANPLAVVPLNLVGEFVAVGGQGPIPAVLLVLGALFVLFSVAVMGYLAAGAVLSPFLNVGLSGREHPPRGR